MSRFSAAEKAPPAIGLPSGSFGEMRLKATVAHAKAVLEWPVRIAGAPDTTPSNRKG